MRTIYWLLLLILLPSQLLAQLFSNPNELGPDCGDLPTGSMAREVCLCAEIDSAVARLECFDNAVNWIRAKQDAATWRLEMLTGDPDTRGLVDGHCLERVEGMLERVEGMRAQLCEERRPKR